MKDARTNALLDTLMKCIAACETCADRCLQEENINMLAACIRKDRDCADACSMAARFVARGSDQTSRILQLCVVTCSACEEECGKHEHGHCRTCAAVCKECRTACEEYMSVTVQ